MYHTLFFDLDNTLYPNDSGLWEVIGARISTYLKDFMGMDPEKITEFRDYCHENFGTTLHGLQSMYVVDEEHYLEYVHDVDLSTILKKDNQLVKMLSALPQRKIVFTNSDIKHTKRVLQYLEIEDFFEKTIDVQMTQPYVKPHKSAFAKALEISGIPSTEGCVFIDDMLPNVISANELGFFSILIGDDGESDYPYQISNIKQLPEMLAGDLK